MTQDMHDRDARLDRLVRELATVARTVERIGSELGTLRAGPVAPPLVPPASAPWSAPTPWAAPAPAAGPPRPGAHPPGAHPPGPPPTPSRAPRVRVRREGLGARLVAATGAAITLLGVVLLLVFAPQGGWFGPGARVIAGAVLGLGLVGVGLRLRARHATGAAALVATGVAALYLGIAAATVVWSFLPTALALVVALVVLGGGLAIADRWGSTGLATGAVAGAALLVPVVGWAAPSVVLALLVVVQAGAAVLALRRRWSAPLLVSTGAAVLSAIVATVQFAVVGAAVGAARPLAAGAVLVLAVAVAVAVATRDVLSRKVGIGAAVAALPPVMAVASTLGRWEGVALAGLVAAGLLVVGVHRHRSALGDQTVAVALGSMSAVAGFQAGTLALAGAALSLLLLGQTVLLAVVARATGLRGPLYAALGYGAFGLALALEVTVPVGAVTTFPVSFLVPVRDVGALITAALAGVLLVLAAAAVLAAVLRHLPPPTRNGRWAVGGGLALVALHGAAATIVSLALLVSPTRAGFLTGHVLVTLSWAAVALVLLARGLRDSAPRVLGGVLVVAAVAKLLLFDLTALDGVARIVAFLGAGLVLLVAGTRYATLVADSPTPEGRTEVAGSQP